MGCHLYSAFLLLVLKAVDTVHLMYQLTQYQAQLRVQYLAQGRNAAPVDRHRKEQPG